MKKPSKIVVIGAGHAGLLAANLLRRYDVEVWEAAKGLPSNHAAILRFRSPAVSDALGVPFSRATVYKAAWDGVTLHNTVSLGLANAYSIRACGEVHVRSINNLDPEDRWLAPGDFTGQLARGASIEFDSPANASNLTCNPSIMFISTMPMPALAKLLDYGFPPGTYFNNQVITVFRYQFARPLCSVVQTVYNCSDTSAALEPWYRATVEQQSLIVERRGDIEQGQVNEVQILNEIFGMWDAVVDLKLEVRKVQKYGKLLPVDELARREFISWATRHFNIYALGRFATWRPGLLLDDIVKDIKVIDRLITSGDSYAHTLAASIK